MQFSHFLAWLYWNPQRDAFVVPYLDRPVAWYGIFFVSGFLIGYLLIVPFITHFLYRTKKLSLLDVLKWPFLIQTLKNGYSHSSTLIDRIISCLDSQTRDQLKKIDSNKKINKGLKLEILKGFNEVLEDPSIKRQDIEKIFPTSLATAKETSYFLSDRLCWFLIIGTLIGARLGIVFLYDWPYYSQHPFEIIKIWKGGLASHGGAIGVALALYAYVLYVRQWTPSFTFLKVLDLISIPVALTGCFIRLGNFVNQEILGLPTTLPWGVIFGDPIDGSFPTSRHPVQLYEALAYFFTFLFLWQVKKKKGDQLSTGVLSGLLLIFVFASRFILEFWKSNQESFMDISILSIQIGQLLSLPFIVLGIFFLCWPQKSSSTLSCKNS